MNPRKEAIEAAWILYSEEEHHGFRYASPRKTLVAALNAAYAIDVAPLEARLKELEEALEAQRQVTLAALNEIERLAASWGLKEIDRHNLEQKVKELEAENQRLKAQVVRLIRENSLMEPQLECKGGDV